MSPVDSMQRIDALCSHVWMVRTFLKHSAEVESDEELATVHRDLYDFMLALGPAYAAGDHAEYLKLALKKLGKLQAAVKLFLAIQPDVSGHMNFQMAARSLRAAADEIAEILALPAGG